MRNPPASTGLAMGERESVSTREDTGRSRPRQHLLYFLPLPHGQGSLRPTLRLMLPQPYHVKPMKVRSAPTSSAADSPG